MPLPLEKGLHKAELQLRFHRGRLVSKTRRPNTRLEQTR